MWLELIVGGRIVTFSQVGTYVDRMGRDPRCEWASRIEAEARKICGKTDEVRFTCDKGDLSIRLHRDAVRSVIRAITEVEPSMPPGAQLFFQRICYFLEHSEELGVGVMDLPGPGQGRPAPH